MESGVATDGGPPATKDDLINKAKHDIERGHAQLEEHDLDAASRTFAKSRQDCDVDLSHKKVTELPEELIDIIKDEVTRLALHRNNLKGLSGLEIRLPECTKLKYLALRNNEIREFPISILSLTHLEVLDLKCNKLEVLPENLDKLQNLRAFAIAKNRIKRLPVCLARMNTLKMISAWKNPIEFPPMDQWALERDEEDERRSNRSNDLDTQRSTEETVKLKRFFTEHMNKERARKDSLEHESADLNSETPRPPTRRKASGRPPIKPSVSGFEYIPSAIPASPMLPKQAPPPPLPNKSYARPGTSPLNAAALRPGIAPLINNSSERNRSNSESQMPTSVKEKRKGYLLRKQQFIATAELKRLNRLSHNRGLSHGSALQSGAVAIMTDSSSPTSPTEADGFRAAFVHRLSSLPEGKRKSRINDPSMDFARGLLYSLNQVAGPIKSLLSVLRHESPGRQATHSSLNRITYTAINMVETLDRQIKDIELSLEETGEDYDRRKSRTSIYEHCEACLSSFAQLGRDLQHHVRDLVVHGNQQYVRSLMHLLYASLIEVRNACKKLGDVEIRPAAVEPYRSLGRGLRTSPESDRPTTSLRHRNASSPMMNGPRSSPRHHTAHQASLSTISRSTSNASFSVHTPESMDNFITYSRSTTLSTNESSENAFGTIEEVGAEAMFRHIWTRVNAACDLALQALPFCRETLARVRSTSSDRNTDMEVAGYGAAYDRCVIALEAATDLKSRLQTLAIQVENDRNNLEFWQLCTAFTRAYIVFAGQIKHIAKPPYNLNCDEIKARVRPLQRMVKEVSQSVTQSPWSMLAVPPGQTPNLMPAQGPQQGHIHNKLSAQLRQQFHYAAQPSLSLQTRGHTPLANSLDPMSAVSAVSSNGLVSGLTTPLPATPMSAALGPAALATVPASLQELPGAAHGYFAQTAGALERARSVSQRR